MASRRILGAAAAAALASAAPPEGYHPVVISGPLIGQSLEILDDTPLSACNTDGQWKWIWGNPNMSKTDTLCLIAQLGLDGWDSSEQRSIAKAKIQVRPLGGFNASGFRSLNDFAGARILDGAATRLSPKLEKRGYELEKSYFGHSYDWRLSVHEWESTSFPELARTIEKAVKLADGRGAVLTGISMAGPYTHSFLSWAKRMDPTWAKKNVHAFVPVGAPFNGAVMAWTAVVSSALQTFSTDGLCPRCMPAKPPKKEAMEQGFIDQFKSWFSLKAMDAADTVLTSLIASWPSMYFMSPAVDYSTNPPTDSLVTTILNGEAPAQCSLAKDIATECGATGTEEGWAFDNPNYLEAAQCAECQKIGAHQACPAGFEQTYNGYFINLCCRKHECQAEQYRASELPSLLRKLGRETDAQRLEYAQTVQTTNAPEVPVHCIIGHNIQTFSNLSFANRGSLAKGEQATIILDDGDMTVDAKSLEVCTRWSSTVKTYRVPGGVHASLLDVDQITDVIVAVAVNDEPFLDAWKEPSYDEVKTSLAASRVSRDNLLIDAKVHEANLVI